MKTLSGIFLIFSMLSSSCSKSSNSGTTDIAPSNLTINVVVSNDSSGNVMFTASATNAVKYNFNFGNYNSQNGVPGNTTYKYSYSGTYNVTVTAVSAGGQTISKSTSVTVAVALALVWSDEFLIPRVLLIPPNGDSILEQEAGDGAIMNWNTIRTGRQTPLYPTEL